MAKIVRKKAIPLIALRGLVVFPYMHLSFDVARPKSVAAVEEAMKTDRMIFLVAQKNEFLEEVTEADLYSMGTVAKIKQKMDLGDGSVRIHIEGISRAYIGSFYASGKFFEATSRSAKTIDDIDPVEYEAVVRTIKAAMGRYRMVLSQGPLQADMFYSLLSEEECENVIDTVGGSFLMRVKDKQELLETLSLSERMHLLVELLSTEFQVMEAEASIMEKVSAQMEENNRDYFLREQAKAIREELGEGEDYDKYSEKIAKATLSPEAREAALDEVRKLEKAQPLSPESAVSKAYLDLILSMPWEKYSEEIYDLPLAQQILDDNHYGLEKVKERIIEQLALSKLTGNTLGTVLCLVGPPGVGKTSIVKSLSDACGRNFVRISLGGIRDEAEIRGHRKTYVGAMAGRIVNAIKQAGTMNPLILLDEIDKVGSDGRGDPSAALLEVLDTEQNHAFRDNYLEVPLDLSKVMFVTTANTLDTVPRPLLDRMEVIELSSYTHEEKEKIALEHLIPREYSNLGLKKIAFKIKDDVISEIIDGYTAEAGVRNLEREIKKLFRKGATEIVSGKKSVTITKASLSKYLGTRKYIDADLPKEPTVGVVTGLAWTSIGGDTLEIEVSVMEGSGKIELTGSLGDVMKESAKIAVSFVRSLSSELNIPADFYKKCDIHIHVPEGATPKDGPSAGIALASALASALTGRAVRRDIAMTGELSLRGRVLAIGGLKEKSLAAYCKGIKTVIIPQDNMKDYDELAQCVKENVRFIPVSSCEKVLEIMLQGEPHAQRTQAPVIKGERRAKHEYS